MGFTKRTNIDNGGSHGVNQTQRNLMDEPLCGMCGYRVLEPVRLLRHQQETFGRKAAPVTEDVPNESLGVLAYVSLVNTLHPTDVERIRHLARTGEADRVGLAPDIRIIRRLHLEKSYSIVSSKKVRKLYKCKADPLDYWRRPKVGDIHFVSEAAGELKPGLWSFYDGMATYCGVTPDDCRDLQLIVAKLNAIPKLY